MMDKNESGVAVKNSLLSSAFLAIDDAKMTKIDLSDFTDDKAILENFYAKRISMKEVNRINSECTVLKEGADPKNAKITDFEMSDDFTAMTVAASVCDKNGKTIFSPEQVPAIQEKSKNLFLAVWDKVEEVNKTTTKKEVDAAEKK